MSTALPSVETLRSTKMAFFQIATAAATGYHAGAMTQMDWEKERQRLAARYAAMEDGELQKIAKDISLLTAVAQETLRAEMSKRGIPGGIESTTTQSNDGRGPDTAKPVIIRKYRDLPEASIAKSILESAGIECFLADDNMVRLDWFYSNLVGGIKLLVREEDAEAAANLLDESRPEKFGVEGVGEYEQPHCPRCDSMDISLDGLDKPTTYAAMFISLPIPVTTRGWKCHACGHEWREDGEVQSASSTPGE
jgi:Putative prokaryotic signal transducing protein